MGMDVGILKEAGIDYESGVKRFMDDAAFYESVLELFLEDTVLDRARIARAAGDRKALFACAHEMKGASGNADLAALFHASEALVELLRNDRGGDDEIESAYQEFERAYIAAKEGIRQAKAAGK